MTRRQRGDGRTLGVITARGGSKGLPGKNIRQLAGKPMIAWSIEAARAASSLDRVIVSTDDEKIAEVSRTAGGDVPFLRPAELALDAATTPEVLRHASTVFPEFRWIVLLQPTSPLRTAADIDATVGHCLYGGAHSAVTVTPTKSPAWMYYLNDTGALTAVLGEVNTITRRQDLRAAYGLNGAVYVIDRDRLQAGIPLVSAGTRGHVMDAERSLDIDTALDFEMAEMIIRRRLGAKTS